MKVNLMDVIEGLIPTETRHPNLSVLVLNLLNRCNLQCKHCYIDASSSEESLPVNLVVRTLKEADELGITSVHLSGGEPLLYDNLATVINSLNRNRKFEISISTNGTLIDKETAELFKKKNVHVQVSIDGPKEYHDQFRRVKGTFQRACESIKVLENEEVSTSIITTVSQENIRWLPWIVKWANSFSISHITFQPLSQLGRGFHIRDKKLTDSQLCDLFLYLSDLGQMYKATSLRFVLAYQMREFLLAHPCVAHACSGAKCHRNVSYEIRKLIVREDGTVLPEFPTLSYRFALGNLNNFTLKELVAKYFVNGYSKYAGFCHDLYEEILPNWSSVFIPWDEIVSERSMSLISE